MPDKYPQPRCSFCRKQQEAVRKLVAGTSKLEDGTYVYICDECIALCVEIIDDELVER